MTTALTRRHLLAAALATGVAVPLGGAGHGWRRRPRTAPHGSRCPHPPGRTVSAPCRCTSSTDPARIRSPAPGAIAN